MKSRGTRYGSATRVKNSMGSKRGAWVTAFGTTTVDTRVMRDVMGFWENYEYRAVIGPMNEETREVAVKEYLLARAELGGDFIELGRHFSVGVNYVATAGRSTGGDALDGDEVRYDIVLELYLHAPAVQRYDERRLLTKGVVMDTRNGRYTNVYVGAVRQMDIDHERGTARIVAGTDRDLFDVTFSLCPMPLEEVDEETVKRWLGERV